MFFGHEHLGKAIALLRDAGGLDQTELAKRIGIKPATLNQYEKGRRGITEEVLKRISEALSSDPIKIWDLAYKAFRYNHYRERAAEEGITTEELIDRVEVQPSNQRLRESFQALKAQEHHFFELTLRARTPQGDLGLASPDLLKMVIKPRGPKRSRGTAVRFDPSRPKATPKSS
jgi:transcriptional regulator with XRE-family HTH domain